MAFTLQERCREHALTQTRSLQEKLGRNSWPRFSKPTRHVSCSPWTLHNIRMLIKHASLAYILDGTSCQQYLHVEMTACSSLLCQPVRLHHPRDFFELYLNIESSQNKNWILDKSVAFQKVNTNGNPSTISFKNPSVMYQAAQPGI